MSWRLAFDSPPINNKQPTTSQPTNNQPTANTHDTKTNKLPTTHPKADTGATHQVMMCLCRSCVRCLVCWWILDVMATNQPTNNPPKSGHRSDNQQPTANQPSNLPPTSQPPAPMIPGERNPSSENRSSDGPAGCAEHLNNNEFYKNKKGKV